MKRMRWAAVFAVCGVAVSARAQETNAPFVRPSGGDEVTFANGTTLRVWDVVTAGVDKLTVRLLRFEKGQEFPVSEQTLNLSSRAASDGKIYLLVSREKVNKQYRHELNLAYKTKAAGTTSTANWSTTPLTVADTGGLETMSVSGVGSSDFTPSKEVVLFGECLRSFEPLKNGPRKSVSLGAADTRKDLKEASAGGAHGFAVTLEWTPAKPASVSVK